MTWTISSSSSRKWVSRLRTAAALPALALVASLARAESTPAPSPVAPDYPVYVSRIADLNAYRLFANSGWDGNWYVGYDTCWIKKFPAIPKGTYAKAYLGARLGRMKIDRKSIKGTDYHVIPGSIYMSISSTAAWSTQQSFQLADTSEIPVEGDPEVPLQAGESQWFWTEVPVSAVTLAGENFVALWSPSKELVNVSSSPVVAAAWGEKGEETWLNQTVKGAPPRVAPASMGASIQYFEPAIALKLIPAGPAQPLEVRLVSWHDATGPHSNPVVTVDVAGRSIERVWLEYAPTNGGGGWTRFGRTLWEAPYTLTIDQTKLPSGRVRLRVVAANVWEQTAASPAFTVEVSARAKK